MATGVADLALVDAELAESDALDCTLAMEGAATSMTLSAISANFSRGVVSGVDARTMRTLLGNLCRKSSWRKEVSVSPGRSPSNCCILRRSWVGFLSPNSSPVKSN